MLTRYLLLGTLLLSGVRASAQVALNKLGSVAVTTYGTELAVSGPNAYLFTSSAGIQRLQVYNVSNPAAPQFVKVIELATSGLPIRHAIINGNTLYVSTFPVLTSLPHSVKLLAIDISNPALPVVTKTQNTVGGDELLLAASGSTLYAVFDVQQYMLVYDSNLTYLQSVTLPYSLSTIIGLTVNGQAGYVQYATPSFATLDLTNPTTPISSAGTTAGTISAASGSLAYGLQFPSYQTSPSANTLRVYNVSAPLAPTLTRSLAATLGTRVAASGQAVFTVGATSPFLTAGPSSAATLRGYYLPGGVAAAAIEAFDATSQGANALVVANNSAYLLTDSNLSIYAFPTTVTATQRAAATATLSCYPNPAHGTLTLPKAAPATPIIISDALGRTCLQAPLPASGTLDISALPAGLYQVRAGSAASKLLVE